MVAMVVVVAEARVAEARALVEGVVVARASVARKGWWWPWWWR